MKKEIPILFSTEMVRAILEGRKTMTRRIVKRQPIDNREVDGNFFQGNHKGFVKIDGHENWRQQFAYEFCRFKKGNIIWVKETWQVTDFLHPEDDNYGYIHKASENGQEWQANSDNWKWRPSIFMPKVAARIWLEVENVRVERLHDITTYDAKAEGVEYKTIVPKHHYHSPFNYKEGFIDLWTNINGDESWNANPWVWVIEFKVLSTTGL